jgi:hypothetical protein
MRGRSDSVARSDARCRLTGYREGVIPELDGSVVIAWEAEGYRQIRVTGWRRSREELTDFARGVADVALLNRSVPTLRTALRERFGGTFDLDARTARDRISEPQVLVSMHPPKGEPNPED